MHCNLNPPNQTKTPNEKPIQEIEREAMQK
jgi:hypothetical protein